MCTRAFLKGVYEVNHLGTYLHIRTYRPYWIVLFCISDWVYVPLFQVDLGGLLYSFLRILLDFTKKVEKTSVFEQRHFH